MTVQVGQRSPRRFELGSDDTSSEDVVAELAMATAGLASALLAEHGWQLVEDSNGEEILLAAVPDRCWQALGPGERGALKPIEPSVRLFRDQGDDKVWN